MATRAVAQFGSAPALGAGGRRFESGQPDHHPPGPTSPSGRTDAGRPSSAKRGPNPTAAVTPHPPEPTLPSGRTNAGRPSSAKRGPNPTAAVTPRGDVEPERDSSLADSYGTIIRAQGAWCPNRSATLPSTRRSTIPAPRRPTTNNPAPACSQ